MSMVPGSTPQQKLDASQKLLKDHGADTSKLCILGVRGYYKDSMGEPGQNDLGIYDDAIFIVGPDCYASFNANVDPVRSRKGFGFGENHGMAHLKPGLWLYQLGLHRGSYLALVQAADVTVIRDGNPPYPDTGDFGIHIHKGGYNNVSSIGCQTIYPDQWDSFIALVQSQMKNLGQHKVQYLLVENA